MRLTTNNPIWDVYAGAAWTYARGDPTAVRCPSSCRSCRGSMGGNVVVVALHDLTTVQYEQSRFRALLDAAPDAVGINDGRGEYGRSTVPPTLASDTNEASSSVSPWRYWYPTVPSASACT